MSSNLRELGTKRMRKDLIQLHKLMTKSTQSGIGGCKNCRNYFPETNSCAKTLNIQLNKKLGILVCANWEEK